MVEAPKTVMIGEVELTQTEALEMLSVFDAPGWRHIERILRQQQEVEVNCAFSGEHKELQDYALTHGIYQALHVFLDLPAQAKHEYNLTFTENELT